MGDKSVFEIFGMSIYDVERELAQKDKRIRELESLASFIEPARDVLVDVRAYFDKYGGMNDYDALRRRVGGTIGVLRDVIITYKALSDKEDDGE